jgi:hypothetical protein
MQIKFSSNCFFIGIYFLLNPCQDIIDAYKTYRYYSANGKYPGLSINCYDRKFLH